MYMYYFLYHFLLFLMLFHSLSASSIILLSSSPPSPPLSPSLSPPLSFSPPPLLLLTTHSYWLSMTFTCAPVALAQPLDLFIISQEIIAMETNYAHPPPGLGELIPGRHIHLSMQSPPKSHETTIYGSSSTGTMSDCVGSG